MKFKPSIFNSANYIIMNSAKKYTKTLARCKKCNKFFNWYNATHIKNKIDWQCPHCASSLLNVHDLSFNLRK